MLLICGNYGSTNLGDEAILDGILMQFRSHSQIIVFSYNPPETERLHHVKAAYLFPMGFRSLIRGIFRLEIIKTLQAYKKCSKFMLGGGGLFTDEKLFAVILWSFHVFLAKIFHKPIEIFAVSVGPLKTGLGRYLTKKACNITEKISVRDQESKDLLIKLGIKQNIEVTSDPALSLSFPKKLPVLRSSKNEGGKSHELQPSYSLPPTPYALLSLRPWIKYQDKIITILPQFLDWLIEKYQFNIIMIPFQQLRDNDSVILEKIKQLTSHKEKIFINPFTSDYRKILPIINSAQLIIGMRLHSLIFSYLLKKPFISINYSDKITNFLKSIHCEKQGIDLSELSFEKLKKVLEINLK